MRVQGVFMLLFWILSRIKKPLHELTLKEQVLAGIAVALVLLFGVTMHVMSWAATPHARPDANPSLRLVVHLKHNYGLQEFQAIQQGMNITQVGQTMKLRFEPRTMELCQQPDVSVRLINRDYTFNEVILHDGKVVSKHRSLQPDYGD
jgi:hypothetical protein